MNESYERALNEVSMLKKTLNSQKTSHQNTLQQLQTTYQIIEQMKQLLRNQQQKSKSLQKQIRQKNNTIQQISRQYEEHITNIKELIDRKDLQIRKYTQIKVSDYDMIRFRVISEVEAQHHEEIETFKREVQKQEFLNNENMFEIKVLRDKNSELVREIERLKDEGRFIEQQLTTLHSTELTKAFASIQQEKLARKQLQKRMQRQKERYTQTINKYHKQMQTLQTQLANISKGKQNYHRQSNLNINVGGSSTLIQLKESEFALQNEKLKRQVKAKSEELDEFNKRHKVEVKQLNKKIDQLQKELNEANYQIKQLQIQIKQSKIATEQQTITKCKRQFDKKQKNLREIHHSDLQSKDKEIRRMQNEILGLKQSMESAQDKNSNKFTHTSKFDDRKEDLNRLQRQNDQLQAQLQKTKNELNQQFNKKKDEEFRNRQTRAMSVQNVKEKLDAANAQIVNLLKDKIALNQKIARMEQIKKANQKV